MKTFRCTCDNTLFFENSACLRCGAAVGWCPACEAISALIPDGNGHRCGNADCGTALQQCHNYALEKVCNRCVLAPAPTRNGMVLCDCCVYNDTIPDLSVAGNREKWARLEEAKRRLIYALDLLGLPREPAAAPHSDGRVALAFDFKADVIPQNELWRQMGELGLHGLTKFRDNVCAAKKVAHERDACMLGVGFVQLNGATSDVSAKPL